MNNFYIVSLKPFPIVVMVHSNMTLMFFPLSV